MQIKLLPRNFILHPSRVQIPPYRLWGLAGLQLLGSQWYTRSHLYRCSGLIAVLRIKQQILFKMTNSIWKQLGVPRLIFSLSPTKCLTKSHWEPCEEFCSGWTGACRYSRREEGSEDNGLLTRPVEDTLSPRHSKDQGAPSDTRFPACTWSLGRHCVQKCGDKTLY